MVSDGMNGLANFQGGLVSRQSKGDRGLCRRSSQLPAVYQATLFAEAGGLMAWAPDLEEQFRSRRVMSIRFSRAPSRAICRSAIQPDTS